MVKINFLETDGLIHKFHVEDVDPTTMNSLRKIINYNLPVYAIEDLDFIENDSVIFDEMLANRIGLCPVTTPAETTGKKVTFVLEKEGPGVVYSGDLKSNDPEIRMVYDNIPLTKLNENERVNLMAYAVLAPGTIHTKHSAAIVGFQKLAKLEVLKGCDACEVCVEACPVNCLKMVSKKPKVTDIKDCINCQACVDACPKSCLKLNDIDSYILNIELIGQLTIENIFKTMERYTKEHYALLKRRFK